jgi:hypothetical protein
MKLLPLHDVMEHIHRMRSDFVHGLCNGRQRRATEAGKLQIIKTHDRHVIRNAHPFVPESLHCSQSHPVIMAKDRGWPGINRLQ